MCIVTGPKAAEASRDSFEAVFRLTGRSGSPMTFSKALAIAQ